jgi:hypothetical protein
MGLYKTEGAYLARDWFYKSAGTDNTNSMKKV